MSALAGIFAKGGHHYRPVPDQIDRLPKGLRHAATVAYRAVMKRLADGQLDESATDNRLGEEMGWSDSLIQKGLNALDRQMEKLGLPPLIERKSGIGMAGRRQIIPAKLAGSRAEPTDPPPAPPPVDGNRKDTTTEAPSSSSPQTTPEKTEPTRDVPTPELVDRACRLILEATPEWVAAMVAAFNADWFARALDVAERRNKRPGNAPVTKRRFVHRTLLNWQAEGGPPAEPKATPTPTPRSTPTATQEPPRRLTPAEVAELVRQCREEDRVIRNLARVQIRSALREGLIDPEVIAIIPADIAEPRAP
jgi:hypothetical protein